MTHCIELVIYHIKPEAQTHFHSVRNDMQSDLSQLEGFLDYQTLQSADNTLCFTDLVKWETQAKAKAAFIQFKHLPHAANFMHCIDKVIFANHFTVYGLGKE